MDTATLEQSIADPENIVDTELKLISGASNIPVRILTGSERGELASSQDENNWNHRVDERRLDFAEPLILRAFIDRLIDFGILPRPKNGLYTVTWPDLDALSEKEQAEIAKSKTEAIAMYVKSGASILIPPTFFLTKIMGMSDEEAEAILNEVLEMIKQEELETPTNTPPTNDGDEDEDEDEDDEE